MMDANIWRDLETVSLFTYDVGSIFYATFSRASRIALMVASGVSGNVLVLHPGGASSLRAQSVIGAKLSSLCRVPLLTVHSRIRMSSVVPVALCCHRRRCRRLHLCLLECHRCFWMLQLISIPVRLFSSLLFRRLACAAYPVGRGYVCSAP